MAVSLKLNTIDEETKNKLMRELNVKPKSSQYVSDPKPIFILSVNKSENSIYVPIGQYEKYFDKFPERKSLPRMNKNAKINFKLLTKETDPTKRGRDQNVVVEEAIKKLDKNHCVFAACFTGFGKTWTGIYLSIKYGYKTAVLCHNDTIKNQWADEFRLTSNDSVKVQIISGNKKFDPDADIYIIGILKAKSLSRKDTAHIGMVIIDEAHICTTTAFTKSLLKFCPNYLIGLSATPERADGLEKLFNFYFGPSKNFIIREEVKQFTVVKHTTNYVPEVSYQYFRGESTLAWTNMMTSLAEIEDRWIEIANIAIKYKTHKIILICDRNSMAENIFDYLEEKGESVELFTENKKTWDKTKRILITNSKKGGVGLNDPSLNMLIIACDMKNVKQCEGRIRTTNNIVIDVVDDYSTLENHWNMRERWYLKRGATIEYGGTSSNLGSLTKKAGGNKKSREVPRFLKPMDEEILEKKLPQNTPRFLKPMGNDFNKEVEPGDDFNKEGEPGDNFNDETDLNKNVKEEKIQKEKKIPHSKKEIPRFLKPM